MTDSTLEIIPCPPERVSEALSLVLSPIAPESREEIFRATLDRYEKQSESWGALAIAHCNGELRGAAWAETQPGNTSFLWTPQWTCDVDSTRSSELIRLVVDSVDASGIMMTQSLLPARDTGAAPALELCGFRHLADLIYLSCEARAFPQGAPDAGDVQLVPYQPNDRLRLEAIIERTYEGTLDCADLNGMRSVEEVLDGYFNTGTSGSELWYLVRCAERDVGALLLAQHAEMNHWELVYVGLVPEARGRAWGMEVMRAMQWMAERAQVERIVLAVDAANHPALAMYRDAGFIEWDRRSVFVRFCGESASEIGLL